jgi:hypothetical protein
MQERQKNVSLSNCDPLWLAYHSVENERFSSLLLTHKMHKRQHISLPETCTEASKYNCCRYMLPERCTTWWSVCRCSTNCTRMFPSCVTICVFSTAGEKTFDTRHPLYRRIPSADAISSPMQENLPASAYTINSAYYPNGIVV